TTVKQTSTIPNVNQENTCPRKALTLLIALMTRAMARTESILCLVSEERIRHYAGCRPWRPPPLPPALGSNELILPCLRVAGLVIHRPLQFQTKMPPAACSVAALLEFRGIHGQSAH